jgi:hypothetical protein
MQLPLKLHWQNASVGDATRSVLTQAQSHKIMEFDLGEIDFDQIDPTPLLTELAGMRSREMYGLRFSSTIRSALGQRNASLLRDAGVYSVLVDLASVKSDCDGQELVLANLKQMEVVKVLHECGISADWGILGYDREQSPTVCSDLIEAFESMFHLPPPREPSSTSSSNKHGDHPLSSCISRWREVHTPWTLTYARGPGFVRIFDRRSRTSEATFFTLRSQQAEIFLFCQIGRSLKSINDRVPGLILNKLQSYLEILVTRGLMCCIPSQYYQSLPVRRRLEEHWAYGI